jgi:hypothetical protein
VQIVGETQQSATKRHVILIMLVWLRPATERIFFPRQTAYMPPRDALGSNQGKRALINDFSRESEPATNPYRGSFIFSVRSYFAARNNACP